MPVSSFISRMAHCSGFSPGSNFPPTPLYSPAKSVLFFSGEELRPYQGKTESIQCMLSWVYGLSSCCSFLLRNFMVVGMEASGEGSFCCNALRYAVLSRTYTFLTPFFPFLYVRMCPRLVQDATE